MPHHTTKLVRGKHRVVVAKTGKLARNRYGTVRDGGGHTSKAAAQKQARVITKITTSREKKK